ncbi:MAG: DoxX family protein [Permianibacter sp.]
MLPTLARFHSRLFARTLLPLDGLPPLLLRLYLFPVFWDAGTHKLNWATGEGLGRLGVNPSVVEWFGNPDWGLGLPFPALLAALAAYTEFFGAILLLLGLGVRWISLPLMITMLVAMITVHWQNGWLAIASGDGFWASERTMAAQEKLARARDLLQEHGNYDWLTEAGNFVVLNNGIEFAATYFLMLLMLLFSGGGRYVSVDYWLHQRFAPRLTPTP